MGFDFDLPEELELLRETVRGFAGQALRPRLREAEAVRAVAPEVRSTFAEIGLAGLELPEPLGGAGLGALARVVVNEELGAADAGAALALDPLGPALYALHELGGEAPLRAHALPLLEDPGARAVLVTAADAELVRGDGVVAGRVPWVPAEHVDRLVLLDADGACVLAEGFEIHPLRGAGLRAAGAAELVLREAPIVRRLAGAAGAARALARARLYAASLLLGVLREAAEFASAYAQQRVAFGRPIAHHQALAFLLVDLHFEVEGARLLLYEAAWRADAGLPFESEAAAAFAQLAAAAREVAPAGVQVLGGHGFMADYPQEKHYREARALACWLGGFEAAREDAGQALVAAPPPLAFSAGERAGAR